LDSGHVAFRSKLVSVKPGVPPRAAGATVEAATGWPVLTNPPYCEIMGAVSEIDFISSRKRKTSLFYAQKRDTVDAK